MLHNLRWTAVAALLSFTSTVLAQTYTNCDPTKQDGCPTDPALGTFAEFNWTTSKTDSQVWNTSVGSIDYTPEGAQFKIARQHDAPTIESMFYFFWGRVSVIMKAAQGNGIVSSVMMMSDDRDEIDWEWIGGNNSYVQSNFFGKGDNTTYDRAVWHPVDNIFAVHNYTTVWTQSQIQWYIDDKLVRTLAYDDPLAKSKAKDAKTGDRFPQTPMTLRLGNWAGGDPALNSAGTVEWANNGNKDGKVDYGAGPYIQTVVGVQVHDFTKAKSYSYGDKSGTYQSITVDSSGNSTITERISHPVGLVNRFNALPMAAKIGIAIAAAVVAGILLILLLFCCIKNRRAGRKERAIADAEWENNLQELQRYKRAMVAEEEIHPRAGYI